MAKASPRRLDTVVATLALQFGRAGYSKARTGEPRAERSAAAAYGIYEERRMRDHDLRVEGRSAAHEVGERLSAATKPGRVASCLLDGKAT